MGRFPNMGRCIISYQEVLRSEVKNINRQADEVILSNHSINVQLHRTSVLTGRLCFGALWIFCLSLNCDSWAVEGKLFFWISLVLSFLLSVILNTCFGDLSVINTGLFLVCICIFLYFVTILCVLFVNYSPPQIRNTCEPSLGRWRFF
jgi:hypothetical protein